MSNLNLLAFGLYPYIALAICLIGLFALVEILAKAEKRLGSLNLDTTKIKDDGKITREEYKRMARPVILMGVLISVISIIIMGWVQPYARYAYRSVVFDIQNVEIFYLAEEGVFMQAGDRTFIIDKLNRATNGATVYADAFSLARWHATQLAADLRTASAKPGLSALAPEAVSSKTRSQPALRSASVCKAVSCSAVDTRA